MLNLTNSTEHPTRPGHTIFHFYAKERANLFEQFLSEEKIQYETSIEEEIEKTTYFFGIKNKDVKIANQKNYLVSAQFRKPLIPNIYFRWTLIAFMLFVVGLAVVSYFKQ